MSDLHVTLSKDLSRKSGQSVESEAPIINYKNEVIFSFYNAMLEVVIDYIEPDVHDVPESINSAEVLITSKPYMHIISEDIAESTPFMVEGSIVSFTKKISADFEAESKISKISKISKKTDKDKRKPKKPLKNVQLAEKSVSLIKAPSIFIPKEEDNSWMVEHIVEDVLIHFKNGNTYQGPIFRKMMHGVGTFIWNDGTKYVGDFKEGEITGNGTMHHSDNSWYKGEFYKGFRHGEGSLLIADTPQIYNGTWDHGQKHGQGWILYGPGNWYEGKWHYEFMNGCGLRQYPSGSRYHGLWGGGLRHGFGSAIMKNCDFYTGGWHRGKRHGYGEYTWKSFYNQTFSFPAENKYRGAWDNDVRHGVGVMVFGMDGGARYAGCFQNNQKHGAGIVICENSEAIESNPLFLKDKPVHLTAEGALNCSPEDQTTCTELTSEPIKSKEDLPITQNTSDFTITSDNDHSVSTGHVSTYQIISKQARSFSAELDKTVLANIAQCKLKFPRIEENFLSLSVPVVTPSDLICFAQYIDNVIQNYEGYEENTDVDTDIDNGEKDLDSFTPITTSSPKLCPTMITLKRTEKDSDSNSSLKIKCTLTGSALAISEEKCLRKTISAILPKLHAIYNQYATVCCIHKLPYKPMLVRLFLWQLYRDCKLPEKGLSLAKIDLLLADNPDSQIESPHDPFEMIYFSQFLHSLLGLSWTLYGCECLGNFETGILSSAFLKFLENDIFPNFGHYRGSVLFDYLDLLPLDYVYQWYKSFGEPLTASEFLNSACQIYPTEPIDTNIQNVFITNGLNAVPLGQNLIYLEEDISNIRTEPDPEKFLTFDRDYFKLNFLGQLGASTIVKLLHKLCPRIIENKDIINMEYPLTFLEFYEVILLCAQEILNIQDKEEQDRIAEIKRLEAEAEALRAVSITSSKKGKKKK